MQLLSLEISGFKSFAKATRLEFAPGVTAVVGPNGCGKSNIVDSLRWVLGEQRSSVLRSDRMDNVIFNGTAVRKPAGLAEVKITLDNSKGLLDLPFTEVGIARRLFRDGTSEYLLNNNVCRLKDITDLLHDSGMGPNQYTILELKMVEDILRDDGEGRRSLFEEAAGVAKYKIRRRQALQKLKQTDDDLLRLADILNEVERQVSSLKRQAMRAKKYTEYSDRLKTIETALIYREYRRLLSELTPLEDALSKSSAATDAVKAAIRLEEAKLQELRRAELDVEKEAAELRKNLADIVSEISTLEAEEAGLRARDQAARQTIERTRRERQLLSDKRAMLEVRLQDVQETQAGIQAELAETEQRVAEASTAAAEAAESLRNAEDDARQHLERVTGLRVRLGECQREQGRVAMARAGISSRRELLTHEHESLNSERQTLNGEHQELSNQLQHIESELQAVREDELQLDAEYRKVSDELARSEERGRSLANLLEATRARLALLATLEEKGPRSHSALRTLKEHPVEGLLDLLGDTIEVEDRYRRALQAALGPAAYYYLTESLESALVAMEMLRRENAGQTTFLALNEFETEQPVMLTPPSGTLGIALSLVHGNTHNSVLRHFLGRVIVVNDWQSAMVHWEWAKHHGCTVVTLDGQWIGSSGILRGGSEEANIPVDLGLGKQVQDLRERLGEAEQERESVMAAMRSLRSELAKLEQSREDLRRRSKSFTEQHAAIREKQLKCETRLLTLDEREQSVIVRLEELDQQNLELDQEHEKSVEAVRIAEQEFKDAESSGSGLSERVSTKRQAAAVLQNDLHQRERERDAVHHRLDLTVAEADRLRQSLDELEVELTNAERNAEQAASDLVGLESRLHEIDELSVQKYRVRDDRAETVDKISVRLDEIRNTVAEQDERIRNLRENHSGELEGSRRIETEVARLHGEVDALVNSARIQHNLDLPAENFVERHSDIADVEATSEILQELKQKIERLGPINSLAVEEYAQESARLDTMLAQREDLLKAKATLEDTIARINETAQAKFLHTFEAVRGHFQRLFTEFFPAGEADLILSGSDLLDADITMWANPSGKRLKSITLMSGGEKTMTAIALLFALYQVKPSPFCVFDEVDAPLDDANIDRFTRMLRIHSEQTQFIVVTHNRRTMEVADNLYGVTMEEEGISKLVSVRLLSSIA